MTILTSTEAQKLLSLEEQIVRLQALLEAARKVHSALGTEEVLRETARLVVRELELEGAAIVSPEGNALASYGSLFPSEEGIHFPLLARDRSLLAEMIVVPGEGVALSMSETDFIEGLVLQAAVALENATLHERDLQWARVRQDLDAARAIQRSLLPKAMPEIGGYSIAGRSITCYEVGGDYLDTVQLADGGHLFVVADVAGKGLASAIVATSFRSAFRSLVTQSIPLVDMVNRVGQLHWEEGAEARRRYVTAIFVRLDPGRGEMEIVNAGHNPALLVNPEGSVRMLEASGTPLGMLSGACYTAEAAEFPPGSRLLLYTDGLTEVFCGEDEFGCERLTAEFRDARMRNASEILDHLWQALHIYATGAAQSDDMTALALCRHPAPQEIACA